MNKMNHFTVLPCIKKDLAIKDHYKIEKLELEVKELQRELREIRERLKDLAFSRDRFGPVKMKDEPYSPF